uniref:Uncharacterized protein n=1 Tax=Parascaris univalens TaxID=6257 RepID=A0A915AAL3_PARUN
MIMCLFVVVHQCSSLLSSHGFPSGSSETEFGRLGTNFPAPKPEDYDTNEVAETNEQSLVAISPSDPPTTTEAFITLFPDEKLEKKDEEFDISFKKHSSNLRSGSLLHTDEEYYDDVRREFNKDEYYQ